MTRDDWRTPPDLFSMLNEEFHFGLDAACSRHNCLAPFGIFRDEGHDALTQRWIPTAGQLSVAGQNWRAPWFEDPKQNLYGRGTVWLNPPYSDPEPWVKKAAAEGAAAIVVALIPADTSTRWWRRHVAEDPRQQTRQIRFLTGRVRFWLPDGSGPAPRNGGGANPRMGSAVVVYGPGADPPRYSYMETPRG